MGEKARLCHGIGLHIDNVTCKRGRGGNEIVACRQADSVTTKINNARIGAGLRAMASP